MTDAQMVENIIAPLRPGDVITVVALGNRQTFGWTLSVQCNRAAWAHAGYRSGRTSEFFIGVSRTRATAEARAGRMTARLNRARSKGRTDGAVDRPERTRSPDEDAAALAEAERAFAPQSVGWDLTRDPVPVAAEPTREMPLGWIMPTGEFYPCGYGSHSRMAELLWWFRFHTTQADPEKAGDRAGWIKAARVGGDLYLIFDDRVVRRPTQAQLNACHRWCEATGKHFKDVAHWWDA